MNKTPITVLQELMMKHKCVPSYECISQTGPQHLSVFEYRCVVQGVTARGVARCKKEAKQEAARRALAALAARGVPVPAPYHTPVADPEPLQPASDSALPLPSTSQEGAEGVGEGGGGMAGRVDARSYVALLKELCEEFRLGAVVYELVGDTGPPHQRQFTVSAALASHERVATATTKKAARQLAAEQLYTYLRENLANATKDFVENRKMDLLKGKSISETCLENDNAELKTRTNDDESQRVQSKFTQNTVNEEIVKECNRMTDLGEESIPDQCAENNTTDKTSRDSPSKGDTTEEIRSECHDVVVNEASVKDIHHGTDLLKEKTMHEKCPVTETAERVSRKRKSADDTSEEVQRKRSEILVDEEILKENEDALCRALNKAMSRYVEVREEQPWRPDLGQRIADYHLGLVAHISEDQRQVAEKALSSGDEDSVEALRATAAAMGLTVDFTALAGDGGALSVVSLAPSSPPVALAGRDPPEAARRALRYLRRALRHPFHPAPA